MKGVVFDILRDMIEEKFGLEGWNQLLEKAGSHGMYLSSESYDDSEMVALLGAASEMTGQDIPTLLRTFGEFMVTFRLTILWNTDPLPQINKRTRCGCLVLHELALVNLVPRDSSARRARVVGRHALAVVLLRRLEPGKGALRTRCPHLARLRPCQRPRAHFARTC